MKAKIEDLLKKIKKIAEENKNLKQDILDFEEAFRTKFVRCKKCKRIHERGYICPYCGFNN